MYQERYQLWSQNEYFDSLTREELIQLTDQKEIEDRFYTDLEFGTGGMRGIIGAGTNRMNRYVVRKVTQGLADHIISIGKEYKRKGVVIAYDSRHFSADFAREAALVLAHNGVKAYIFEELSPTPVLSFAVRYLKAVAGIVITASHNPQEYNGYKIYWEDGGQIPPEQADVISEKIQERKDWTGIQLADEKEAQNQGLFSWIGKEVEQAYFDKVQELMIHPELIHEAGDQLKIVYSPLHGAGNKFVRSILEQAGFHSVYVVAEQEKPDPFFTTAPLPNPEIPSTFDLARRYGEKLGADLLLATDPDADRLGVVIQNSQGDYVQLSGNQIGVLLMQYLITEKQRQRTLPDKATIVKTVASTDLADQIAHDRGIKVENVLTGFKFIAEKEKEMEEQGWGTFLFGFEESYGYLAGDFVRDKDGIIAALLVCEAALYYKKMEKKSLIDVLEQIYQQYGYYIEEQISFTFKGKDGKDKIQQIMDQLREEEIHSLGGQAVCTISDYEKRMETDLIHHRTYALTLPRSNVLRFSFHGGGFAMARPSGTEPKIKFYFSVKGCDPETAREILNKVKASLIELVNLKQ